jgi:L-lactate dehydrogenase complex protein LldG
MTSREEVLARIRRALGPAGAGGDSAPEGGAAAYGHRTRSTADSAHLVSLLTERLSDYGSSVRHCTAGQLGRELAEALASRGVARAVVAPDFEVGLLPEGVQCVADHGLTAVELDTFDAVITMATVVIAETGTIVLDGSTGQGRRALSLIPDYHLCIVRERQVVGLVPEALARLQPERPLTWISGPSATSDIELDRVEGVHGPRTMEVIVVSEG